MITPPNAPTPQPPLGQRLNTPSIANAGVSLCVTSCGVLGSLIVSSTSSSAHTCNAIGMAFAFAGIVVGVALAYVGRPSTLPKS